MPARVASQKPLRAAEVIVFQKKSLSAFLRALCGLPILALVESGLRRKDRLSGTSFRRAEDTP